MNNIKEIQRINERQLAEGGNSSWHDQYKDSAYIFVGGLDYELTEGDVVTIFSQYGEVADVNMPRDKTTGKTKGFAFLMYEDQRSTVLAVDNLNGAKVVDRILRVDHVSKYKQLEKGEDGKFKERESQSLNALPELFVKKDEEDSDSADSDMAGIDPDDPMAAYLLEQAKAKKRKKSKHAGETKEERAERKARKREKKKLKATSVSSRDRDRDRDREPESRSERRDDRDSRRDRYRDDSPPPRERDARRDRYRDDSPAPRERDSYRERHRDDSPRERERERERERDRYRDRDERDRGSRRDSR